MRAAEFDYIIIGAGSAGSTLAYRLGEDLDLKVLVLEAGPMDHHLFIHMPSAFAYPMANPRYSWQFEAEADPGMNNRRIHCPRGKTIGGSSSINGMVYIRGHAEDYNGWAEQFGLPEWRYAHCLPYFRKSETRERGGDEYRGSDGPLKVSTGACKNPLYNAFVEAGQQAGYGYTADMNGHRQEGFGPMDMTVHKGRRWSTAMAYLRPALQRGNVTLHTGTAVSRIVFEGRAQPRAVGVEVEQGGQKVVYRARREVLLSAGAIQSPQLLQLSGVGPADLLRSLGIPVVADRRGVGENLQDHLETYVQYACKEPITLYAATKPLAMGAIGAQWLLTRTGLGATNHFESGGFIRSDAGVKHPDLQYHFLPMAVRYDGSATVEGHGFQAHVGPMRSTSRGHVRIRSTSHRDAPEIRFNYMSTEQDRKEFRAAIRLTREVFAQQAFDRYRAQELSPTAQVRSDAEIDEHIRSQAETAYHPSCSCRMGHDELAVVDGQGRVHGVQGLRVVDASIMPVIVSGNLNVPTIMMAEKIADAIKGRALPPSDAPVWLHPNWQAQQR
ncbi:choline dehydrogenase [Hydrogenophaga pseudoflava]|uniref:choline dehydrogenase n=1 Tax=Hydrogenophaga pseudoflava TaxID=47421 RepID=UPI0027E46980|nr:choline dehydrogenase [Hydrogenophaga pseudoflava]MDQ7746655.1 choline dehydrogenase [Hydrogenophaga pseudoflava]